MIKIKRLSWFLIAIMANFYLLPLCIFDTGSAMLVMIVIMPVICFVSAILYGVFGGFNILCPLLVALLFIPNIWLYFNDSAWVYTFAYGVLAFIGNVIGVLIDKIVKIVRNSGL